MTTISVARGDGIGPEIVDAALRVLAAAGARLTVDHIDIGQKVQRGGADCGAGPQALDSIRRTGVLLKAPTSVPPGSGFRGLTAVLRKRFGLYANVRPCRRLTTGHDRGPASDLVIVRENEEDLYSGIEHRQSEEAYHCLKLVSRPGCERVIRVAFEFARLHGRRKVTCLTKDNVMKLTDGLFRQVFHEIGREYPEIKQDHLIVDVGAARLATRPDRFDVIVTLNLYGDILSDIAAEVVGSLGSSCSAHLGDQAAVFEPIHGAACDIAGKGKANPSAMIQAAVMMLAHVGQTDVARLVGNAWLRTFEDGLGTGHGFENGLGVSETVSTSGFAEAVIARLGVQPSRLQPVVFGEAPGGLHLKPYARRAPPAVKTLVGVDVFIDEPNATPAELLRKLQAGDDQPLELASIANRARQIWPGDAQGVFCTDIWRCRFLARPHKHPTAFDVVALLGALAAQGAAFVKTEQLFEFDGKPGFSIH